MSGRTAAAPTCTSLFTAAELATVFGEWNAGELESYLIQITAKALRQRDPETGRVREYDEAFGASEDVELWTRTASALRVANLPEPLLFLFLLLEFLSRQIAAVDLHQRVLAAGEAPAADGVAVAVCVAVACGWDRILRSTAFTRADSSRGLNGLET